jgi:hypothetical protein
MSTLAIRREIELFERYICVGVQGSAAYENNPTESNLHELGHVLTAKGLRQAVLDREKLEELVDVEDFCQSIPRSDRDRNEYEAIAFTFLVARQIGFEIDENQITAEANTLDTVESVEEHSKEVARALDRRHIQKLAHDFVNMIRGDCNE